MNEFQFSTKNLLANVHSGKCPGNFINGAKLAASVEPASIHIFLASAKR